MSHTKLNALRVQSYFNISHRRHLFIYNIVLRIQDLYGLINLLKSKLLRFALNQTNIALTVSPLLPHYFNLFIDYPQLLLQNVVVRGCLSNLIVQNRIILANLSDLIKSVIKLLQFYDTVVFI